MGPNNSAHTYEEVRKQRLEDNKKRMEELNLVALSNSYSDVRNSANKRTPQRNVKPRAPKQGRGHPVSVRRSSRVANIPASDYREKVLFSREGIEAKNEASSTLKKVEDKSIGKKGHKAFKDPNKPRKPQSAFFIFMDEFRKVYKEKHPELKTIAVKVGIAGSGKWKSLSETDKAPYAAKAAKMKTEYENYYMVAYNNKQTSTSGAEGSDKSKSEVNDEHDEESGEVSEQVERTMIMSKY